MDGRRKHFGGFLRNVQYICLEEDRTLIYPLTLYSDMHQNWGSKYVFDYILKYLYQYSLFGLILEEIVVYSIIDTLYCCFANTISLILY